MSLSKKSCLRWILVVSMVFGLILPWTPKELADWFLFTAYLFAVSLGFLWFKEDTEDGEDKVASKLLQFWIWVLPLLFMTYYYMSRKGMAGFRFVGKFFLFYLANCLIVVISTGIMTVIGQKIATL